MNILVIGSGGREHALAWKLAQSKRVSRVITAPGNAGTFTTNARVSSDDIDGLLALARAERVDLTVVGPEAPLVAGITDAFLAAGLRVFGPSGAAAQLEGSKAFAKQIMRDAGVPTAAHATFTDLNEAIAFVHRMPFETSPGCVVKADGLAAGKGVFVCDDIDDADIALTRCMAEREFGAAGDTVVIEERMSGPEVSVLAFCDGVTVKPMLPARDHKRVGDGDSGPNTGGMGAFAPAADVSPELIEHARRDCMQPVLDVMRARGAPYRGVLYAGLMLTPSGPRVLEFNCRFGDPETQAILPLLNSDLVDVFDACIDGRLDALDLAWSHHCAASVVVASPGYPGVYPKGLPISGLDAVPDGVIVFHAGTATDPDGRVVTSGGRVLNVTALGATLDAALESAYRGVNAVCFDGMHFRRDIGRTSGSSASRVA
jgi:phosphoribosylamine--glycine ligase